MEMSQIRWSQLESGKFQQLCVGPSVQNGPPAEGPRENPPTWPVASFAGKHIAEPRLAC